MKQVLVYISFGLMTGLGIFMWNAAAEQRQQRAEYCAQLQNQGIEDILTLGMNQDNDMEYANEALEQLQAYNRDCK